MFELTTRLALYKYEPLVLESVELDEVEHVLYQMMLFTGEDFEPEQLRVSGRAAEYFDNTCTCLIIPLSHHLSFYFYFFSQCFFR